MATIQAKLLLGEAFALEPQLRQQFQIVTKCGIQFPSAQRPHQRAHIYNTSATHIIASAENSLRSMRLEKIDLLLIHRPDPLMDADEIADAFSQLKQAGKVSHFGVSNFSPAQFELLASRFLSLLIKWNALCCIMRLSMMEPLISANDFVCRR